jgi:hypothetical protein
MSDHIPDATKMINDGGAAFPSIYYSEPIGSIGPQLTIKGGMTIRDVFAAAALPQVDQRSHGNPDEIALECYQLADAMLKAREAKP